MRAILLPLTLGLVAGSSPSQLIIGPPGGSIQSLIDAAPSGAVIVLTTSGVYSPFVISGKSLSVIVDPLTGGRYTVQASATGPTIRVVGSLVTDNVSVSDFVISLTSAAGAAVLVDNNKGAVRVSTGTVNFPNPILNASYEGLIEARNNTGPVSLHRVDTQTVISGGNPTPGGSATSIHQFNALAGLYLIGTTASAHQSTFNGAGSPGGNQRSGDGVRVDAGSRLWLASSGAQTNLTPGFGFGFAVHDIATTNLVETCRSFLSPSGTGLEFGQANVPATTPRCATVDEATLGAFLATGGVVANQSVLFTLGCSPTGGSRFFTMLVGLGSINTDTSLLSAVFGGIPGVGRVIVPILPPTVVFSGTVPATPPNLSFSATIPAGTPPGVQLTFQAVVFEPSGAPVGLSMSSAVTLVTR